VCSSLDRCVSDLGLNVEMFLLSDGVEQNVNSSTILYVDSAHEMMVMHVGGRILRHSIRHTYSIF